MNEPQSLQRLQLFSVLERLHCKNLKNEKFCRLKLIQISDKSPFVRFNVPDCDAAYNHVWPKVWCSSSSQDMIRLVHSADTLVLEILSKVQPSYCVKD